MDELDNLLRELGGVVSEPGPLPQTPEKTKQMTGPDQNAAPSKSTTMNPIVVKTPPRPLTTTSSQPDASTVQPMSRQGAWPQVEVADSRNASPREPVVSSEQRIQLSSSQNSMTAKSPKSSQEQLRPSTMTPFKPHQPPSTTTIPKQNDALNMKQSLIPAASTGEVIHPCTVCKQPIMNESPIHALGGYYHAAHFQCSQCANVLDIRSFFELKSALWCKDCVDRDILLPKCAYCNEPIKGRCINALEKHWHHDHFFCCQCGLTFQANQPFMVHDGKAYCESDYKAMFAPKCAVCDKSITGRVVTALGASFHDACFVCAEQGCAVKLLEAGSFYDHNGRPYCETHYHAARGTLCDTCGKPVVGRCLTALGKKFHPNHFVCTHCKCAISLTGNGSAPNFKERSTKPYCIPCHIRLFE